MALLKSVFSTDASQVTLKLFLSRVNNPRSLALLCWSLNDCFAFLWTLSTFSESHWAMENQSWPSSVTVLICAEQCSNYLMIQTCFSFATVLCLHFFFSINRTAGLWQFLPVSWLSTKAILLIFQPTAFEWLAPCLWTCSLFNSKCIILNFFFFCWTASGLCPIISVDQHCLLGPLQAAEIFLFVVTNRRGLGFSLPALHFRLISALVRLH